MAGDLKLIVEMVVVLGSATVGGFIAHRLRQPVSIGSPANKVISIVYLKNWSRAEIL